MVAITMPSTDSLVKILAAEFPNILFTAGSSFAWSPANNCITYLAHSSDTSSLLHELSHALLGHTNYQRDIELLGQERDAWSYASQLASNYGIVIADEIAQAALDTYRDWLHARSTCPACSATGMQTAQSTYACQACRTRWQVNSATTCALRRYQIKKRTT